MTIFSIQVLFITVDSDDAEYESILELYRVEKSDLPAVLLVTLTDDSTKYKPDLSDITATDLKTFVDAYFDGKLKPYLRSQEVPEDWDKDPVKVLVGKNFDEVAKDRSKTVLVAFIAAW